MENIFANNLIYLRELKGETQAETATALSLTRSTYANYEIGANQPKTDVIMKIIGHFGVEFEKIVSVDLSNSKDLEKYEGNKNKQNSKENSKEKGKDLTKNTLGEPSVSYGKSMLPKVVTIDTQGNENVVYVPVKARAGYLNGYGDTEFISHLPAYRLPGLNNGTFRLFEADGLSMYPTLHSGDVIIGSFVESLATLRDDRVYVVVTKNDGVVVKRVLNRIETDGKLILKSDNYKDRDQYPTIVVSPDDILEVWYATGFLSRQMRPPAEMYNRLIDLEGKFTLMEEKLKKIN